MVGNSTNKSRAEANHLNNQKYYVGNDIFRLLDPIQLNYPLKYGRIEDWESMIRIWSYTFDRLSIDPSEHPMFIIESLLYDQSDKEKIAEILFETFSVPAIYIAIQAILTVLSRTLLVRFKCTTSM